MKRDVKVILSVLLVSFLVISIFAVPLASASWLSDLWNNLFGKKTAQFAPPVCTDSDSGTSYNAKGTIIAYNSQGAQVTLTDSCVTSLVLQEYFCMLDKSGMPTQYIDSKQYTCPNGCSDGACLGAAPTPTCTDRIQNQGETGIDCGGPCTACAVVPTCTDSDGGDNVFLKGEVRAGTAGGYDHCDNATTLHEGVCVNGQAIALPRDCQYGCSEGVCLSAAPNVICSYGAADLYYGATTVQTLEGHSYDVSIVDINEEGVILDINGGFETRKLGKGDSYKVDADSYLTVLDISYSSRAGGNRKVSFGIGPYGCASPAPTNCINLSLIFANGKTTYVQGEDVAYSWACLPAGMITNYVETQILNSDGATTTLGSSSGASGETSGFGTDNLIPGNYALRACLGVGCLPSPTATAKFYVVPSANGTACTDSDGGKNYSVKGTASQSGFDSDSDWCESNTVLREGICDYSRVGPNYLNYVPYTCPHGCRDGACLAAPNETSTCSALVDIAKNPRETIEINGIDYMSDGYTDSYSSSWWIDGKEYDYTGYTTSLYAYNGEDMVDQANIYLSFMVFDDESVDLTSLFDENYFSSTICRAIEFSRDNFVYVCNYGIFNDILGYNQDSTYSYDYKSVYWKNKNVMVEMDVSSGRRLTDEELTLVATKKLDTFLNGFADNQYKYFSSGEPSSFGVNYLGRTFIEDSLTDCKSELDVNKCYPNWACKLEPVVCPEYGTQKLVCIDSSCGLPNQEQTKECSPGICSGCYVPKWFGSFDNKCIPYGFRFSQETADFTEKLVENTENSVLEEGNMGDDFKLEVISETEAVFTLFDRNGSEYVYNLVEGGKTEINLPDWAGNIQDVVLNVNNIVYSSNVDVKSYVDITITFNQLVRTQDKVNMYCDIDGQVKQQKLVEPDGSWAKCQNNYECDSNFCSGGECLELNTMIKNVSKEVGTWKVLVSKIICRFGHIFSIEDYEQCVATRIGVV